MKHKISSKKANMAVSKAIKIITSVVLGSALMAGLCVTVKQTVLPTTTTKVESMFGITGDITEDLGGGVFPTADRFEDGPCISYYYDTLQNAIADASAHTTANANADENTANAVIDVRQSDDMYIVKPTKDQTVASSLAISNKVIFDTNGKQIQLAAGAEFKPQAGSEVTFRDSGTGKVYKDVNSSNTEMIINAQGVSNCTINVLNGTYNLKNNSKPALVLRSDGIVKIKNGNFSSESNTVATTLVSFSDTEIKGGKFSTYTKTSNSNTIQLGGRIKISGGEVNAVSEGSTAQCFVLTKSANAVIENVKCIAQSTSTTSNLSSVQIIVLTNVGTNSLIINNATLIGENACANSSQKYGDVGILVNKGNNSVTINGGTVSTKNKKSSNYTINVRKDNVGIVNVKNANIKTYGESKNNISMFGVDNVENCTVETSTTEGSVFGLGNVKTVKNSNIRCWATNDSKTHTAQVFGLCYDKDSPENVLVENTSVICDYNLESVSVADDYTCEGIQIPGSSLIQSLTINNCNIKATREALSLNTGNTCISGGTYEGIQHGGAYFNSPKVVVRNATFRKWNYDGQFNKNNFYSYNAAFYIGNPNHEVKVYMDNCKLENATNAVLSSSYSYKNTYLYASNTAFNNIRIDGANSSGNKGHMYIGKGTTYQSTSGSGELDTTTYANTEFTPEYVKNNFN